VAAGYNPVDLFARGYDIASKIVEFVAAGHYPQFYMKLINIMRRLKYVMRYEIERRGCNIDDEPNI
jgi:hypothetical protein